MLDLFFGSLRIFVEECFGGQDDSTEAEPTLRRLLRDKNAQMGCSITFRRSQTARASISVPANTGVTQERMTDPSRERTKPRTGPSRIRTAAF